MKNFSIELKWGVIFIISGILWVWLEAIFGLHDVYIAQHPLYTNFFGIIAVVIYILALREKKQKFFKGEMPWKEGFTSGIILTIVITLLSPLSQYVVYTFISPSYFQNVIEYSIENNKMTQEQAEAYFSLRSYMIQATFGALVMGVVTAAVVAWFVRTKKVE